MALDPIWGGGDDGHVLDESMWLRNGTMVCERCRVSLRGVSRFDYPCQEEEEVEQLVSVLP